MLPVGREPRLYDTLIHIPESFQSLTDRIFVTLANLGSSSLSRAFDVNQLIYATFSESLGELGGARGEGQDRLEKVD